ncbi:MAG: DUF2624 family protein [Sporolactobacillus sp.]
MNPFIQQIVNQRINQVSAEELYQQAAQMQIPVSEEQARQIADQVRGKNIDLFTTSGQQTLMAILKRELGPEMADELYQYFQQIMEKFK